MTFSSFLVFSFSHTTGISLLEECVYFTHFQSQSSYYGRKESSRLEVGKCTFPALNTFQCLHFVQTLLYLFVNTCKYEEECLYADKDHTCGGCENALSFSGKEVNGETMILWRMGQETEDEMK